MESDLDCLDSSLKTGKQENMMEMCYFEFTDTRYNGIYAYLNKPSIANPHVQICGFDLLLHLL